MMKDLIILGAGGHGQEVALLAESINRHEEQWNIIGFLDRDPGLHGKTVLKYPVLGSDEEIELYRNAYFMLGIGEPRLRRKIVEDLEHFSLKWASLISPTARIPPYNEIGEGAMIDKGVWLSAGCKIGRWIILNVSVVVGHSVKIGDYSVVAPNVTINGEAKLGEACFVGANSYVRDVTVGNYVTIGGGSSVVKDIEDNCVVAGSPAEVIRRGAPRHTVTKVQRKK